MGLAGRAPLYRSPLYHAPITRRHLGDEPLPWSLSGDCSPRACRRRRTGRLPKRASPWAWRDRLLSADRSRDPAMIGGRVGRARGAADAEPAAALECVAHALDGDTI